MRFTLRFRIPMYVSVETEMFQSVSEIEIINYSHRSLFNGVKRLQMVPRRSSTNVGKVLDVGPDLCFVKQQPSTRRELLCSFIEHAELSIEYQSQFHPILQVTPEMDVARNVNTQDPDTLGDR